MRQELHRWRVTIVPTHVGVNRAKGRSLSAFIIVPTHVGVNRHAAAARGRRDNCPHACGGEPETRQAGMHWRGLSPRMWG